MKIIVAYGLKFENETLGEEASIYLDGSSAFETKEEALEHLRAIRRDGSVKKGEKVKVFKFIIEEEK